MRVLLRGACLHSFEDACWCMGMPPCSCIHPHRPKYARIASARLVTEASIVNKCSPDMLDALLVGSRVHHRLRQDTTLWHEASYPACHIKLLRGKLAVMVGNERCVRVRKTAPEKLSKQHVCQHAVRLAKQGQK